MRSGRDGKWIKDLITPSWIQRFRNRYNMVTRRQTGKLQVSPAGQEEIDRRVANFLGTIAQEFQSGQLDECNVENADETHFLINMDNVRTLGFRSDEHVKYADVSSGGEGMKMMVRNSGGPDAVVEMAFLIFNNRDSNYPIREVPDDVPGVSFRTSTKGWSTGEL